MMNFQSPPNNTIPLHKLHRPVNLNKQPTSTPSVQFLIVCTASEQMHLCYKVYIWAAPRLFINCAPVVCCVIVSTTTLEVGWPEKLSINFPWPQPRDQMCFPLARLFGSHTYLQRLTRLIEHQHAIIFDGLTFLLADKTQLFPVRAFLRT